MSETQGSGAAQSKAASVKRFLPLIILVVLIVVAYVNGWHKYLSLTQIAENREALRGYVDANYVLAIGVYAALYVAVAALSIPGGAPLTIAGGFLFGWLIGGMTTVIAATGGATILFLVAKTALGETLAARAGPWLQKLSEGFRNNALSYLLFLRLVPAFPFWLVNLAPALLGVPLATFVIGTLVGIIPGTFAFAFLGAGLDSIIDKQRETYQACLDKQSETAGSSECTFTLSTSSLVTPELIAAFVALGIVAIIPVIAKKVRARRTASS